jgi:predicted hotdog family 3-hydroxylacyl-ACP dehydratase
MNISMTLAKSICKPELADYLPHKNSMLLLDRIVGYDLSTYRLLSEVDIWEDNLFFNPDLGGVGAWTGFEYMAQSIAALSGVHAKTVLDIEPKIGFIMSIRAFETKVAAFPPGKTLQIGVEQLFREGSVVAFNCNILLDGQEITTAVVNAIEIESMEKLYEVIGE